VTDEDSSGRVLIRRPATPSGESRSSVPSPLPPELLASAGRRLGDVALIYAAVYSVLWAIGLFTMRLGAMEGMEDTEPWNTITLVFTALSLGVWLAARSGRLPPHWVLDVALVYEVVGAIGIEIGLLWTPREVPAAMAASLSWTTVWIVMFPLLVPATPGKTFVAALIAASMRPLFVLILIARGHDMPNAGVMIQIALPNYICAFLALAGSKIVYGLGREVEKAQRMGSYRLVERLGAGGMGEVWRAEHRLLAMPAAIKLIRPDALGGGDGDGRREMLRRFEREARAIAALTSPHTVQLHDFGIADDGTFYYVMELLQGLDADAMVRRFGPLPPARAVHVLRQVCESLAEAHRCGLIHRDIKPANVFLCRRGLTHDFVKVLDFGLVKAVTGSGNAETALTRQHAAAGTPAFMAPETALGEADVDARADIYAVGCLAYWLLTGAFVFEGSEVQVAVAHVGAEPRRPSARIAREIPAELEDLVLACLAKDRNRRPASAEELAKLLAALPLPDVWDSEIAAAWWRSQLPDLAAPALPSRAPDTRR
jgi:serine/threonine-protein kinase